MRIDDHHYIDVCICSNVYGLIIIVLTCMNYYRVDQLWGNILAYCCVLFFDFWLLTDLTKLIQSGHVLTTTYTPPWKPRAGEPLWTPW